MTSSILTILILTTVLAGKLHDDNGFRGKQFGPASVLSEAPMSGCVKNPEEDVLWSCKTTLGEHPLTASYMVSEGLYMGMVLTSSGYSTCYGIKDILTAAWGNPRQENLYIEKYVWFDKPMFASWDYRFDDSCTVVMLNLDVSTQAEANKRKKAEGAIGDL